MTRLAVQVTGLEPSTEESLSTYVIQIRGADSKGNYGQWSRPFAFLTSDAIAITEEDILPGETVNYVRSDGSVPFLAPVEGVDPVDDSDLSTKSYVDSAASAAKSAAKNVDSVSPSQGSVSISLSGGPFFSHDIDGAVSYIFTNIEAGREISIKITSTGTNNLTFPALVFMGTPPTSIADTKTGILTIKSFGSNLSDCVATYEVES
jgi:hypothetical protein